jgi:hypothetical protein
MDPPNPDPQHCLEKVPKLPIDRYGTPIQEGELSTLTEQTELKMLVMG